MAGPLRRVTDYDRDRPRPRKRRGLIRKPKYRFLRKVGAPGRPGQASAVVPPPIVQEALRKLRRMRRWDGPAGGR
jgi:hypothetical protein